MRRAVALLLTLGLSLTVAAGEGGDQDASELETELRTVATLTAQGRHSEALALATRLVARAPRSLEAHIAIQDLRLAAGSRKELIQEYAKRAGGKDVAADDVYLHARLLTGSRGISALKQVLRMEPRHFHALCSLGSAYTEAGKLPEGEQALRLASEVDPASAVPLCCLGWLLETRGDDEAAEEQYRRAIERDPGHALSHLNLGALLLATGRLEDAEKSIEEARRLAPGDPMPLLAMGMLLSAKAEARAAEEKEGDRKEPEGPGDEPGGEGDGGGDGPGGEDPAAPEGGRDPLPPEDGKDPGAPGGGRDPEGGQDGQEAGSDEEGEGAVTPRSLFEQAVKMKTNTVASLNMLGSTYIDLEEFGLARQCFAKALGLAEDDLLSLLNLARLYLVQNLPDKAILWAKQAIKVDSKSPEAHYFYGLCLAAQGKRRTAEKSYATAAGLDPGNVLYLRALGSLYVTLGKWRDAVRTFTRAIDVDPGSLDLLLDLAFAHSGAGDAARAAACFEEVLDDDPDVLTAWLNLGLLYQEKLRRPDLAIEAFEEYLERGGKDVRVEGWLKELRRQ